MDVWKLKVSQEETNCKSGGHKQCAPIAESPCSFESE